MNPEEQAPAESKAPVYEVEVDRIEVTAIIAVRRDGQKRDEIRFDPVMLCHPFAPKLAALLEKCREQVAQQVAQALETAP